MRIFDLDEDSEERLASASVLHKSTRMIQLPVFGGPFNRRQFDITQYRGAESPWRHRRYEPH